MSAIARRERAGDLNVTQRTEALGRLDVISSNWHEIEPVESVRRVARRLLQVHQVRAADALQLGAALVAAQGDPSTLSFVSLDGQLNAAAQREGFAVPGAGISA